MFEQTMTAREDHHQGVFRHAAGGVMGHVRHRDAALVRGGKFDVIHTRRGNADQLELWQQLHLFCLHQMFIRDDHFDTLAIGQRQLRHRRIVKRPIFTVRL